MSDYAPIAHGVETTHGDLCFIRYPIPGNGVTQTSNPFIDRSFDWFSLFGTAAAASKESKDFALLPFLPPFADVLYSSRAVPLLAQVCAFPSRTN